MLEFAPAAAAQAAAVGAHRQAALLLAMALRVADAAPLALRAQLHESWSYEAGLALRIDAEVVQARHRALALWRQLGRIDKIGLNLRWLSRLHWYQGDAAEAERYAAEAVEVLQAHPPGAELAWAYATRAQLHMLRDRVEPARLWGERAMSLARRLGEREVLCHALNSVGTATLFAGHAEGAALLERSLALARESGFHEQAARAYSNIAEHAVVSKDFARAEVWLAEGIAFNRRFDLDAWRPYLVGWQAQLRLEQGRYEEALAIAAEVLAMSRLTTIMKLPALTVRAWTLLRCGAPEARGVLDEALAIARPTREGHRILPLLQAQAESRWLAGDEAGAAAALQTLGELPEQQSSPWAAGALATWLRRCGRSAALPARPAEPWALELAGRPDLAAEAWARLGLPFEAGVARLQQALAGDAPEAALADAQRLLAPLGAAPALARLQVLARRHGLALQRRRGPYARSRQHPNGLTGREQQVLALLAEGRANADIAGVGRGDELAQEGLQQQAVVAFHAGEQVRLARLRSGEQVDGAHAARLAEAVERRPPGRAGDGDPALGEQRVENGFAGGVEHIGECGIEAGGRDAVLYGQRCNDDPLRFAQALLPHQFAQAGVALVVRSAEQVAEHVVVETAGDPGAARLWQRAVVLGGPGVATGVKHQRRTAAALERGDLSDDDDMVAALVAEARAAFEAGGAAFQQRHAGARCGHDLQAGELVFARAGEHVREAVLLSRKHMHRPVLGVHEHRQATRGLGQAPKHHRRIERDGVEAVRGEAHRGPVARARGDDRDAGGEGSERGAEGLRIMGPRRHH